MLAKAIALAAQAHVDQVDRAGQPYILHPLRMMMRLATQSAALRTEEREDAQIVAILHDVVEDTPTTLEDLRAAGFAERILDAIDCVTRREEESYDEFVTRSESNPLARLVKLADLEDNMDLKRIGVLTDDDVARLNRYHRAWRRLQTTDNDES
ncbi:MAG TPA: HD domain-containing protein [Caldilineaceae bacterium]|nr:HD domain-containing protein [Caldilineaceae bacterium]